jgi:hypothetical protein
VFEFQSFDSNYCCAFASVSTISRTRVEPTASPTMRDSP